MTFRYEVLLRRDGDGPANVYAIEDPSATDPPRAAHFDLTRRAWRFDAGAIHRARTRPRPPGEGGVRPVDRTEAEAAARLLGTELPDEDRLIRTLDEGVLVERLARVDRAARPTDGPLTLTVAGTRFAVTSSSFTGEIGGRMAIQVHAEERTVGDVRWRPTLGDHVWDAPFPGLDALVGWEHHGPAPSALTPAARPLGEPPFVLSVFDHHPVRDVVVRFGTWHGRSVEIGLAGSVQMPGNAEPPDQVVAVRGLLPFDGDRPPPGLSR